jgi:pantoate--beta-alanine ligase
MLLVEYVIIIRLFCNLFFEILKIMQVAKTISELKLFLDIRRQEGVQVGFVPTMGALHEGHLSLVKKSVEENTVTAVSIFVNPTQFNDQSDLNNYPRTLQADLNLLEDLRVDVVFAPSEQEVYPEPDHRVFSYPPIDTVMEGAKRPGHFNGVCQIVSKLFEWVSPDRAYFGEKDFQQIAVIRAMIQDQGFPVNLCSCPIVREPSGLAMSSRNTLLTQAERAIAANIYRILMQSVDLFKTQDVSYIKQFVISSLDQIAGLRVEYFEIVDGYSLQPIAAWSDSPYIVGCITVFCGERPVRLIDNITYKSPF